MEASADLRLGEDLEEPGTEGVEGTGEQRRDESGAPSGAAGEGQRPRRRRRGRGGRRRGGDREQSGAAPQNEMLPSGRLDEPPEDFADVLDEALDVDMLPPTTAAAPIRGTGDRESAGRETGDTDEVRRKRRRRRRGSRDRGETGGRTAAAPGAPRGEGALRDAGRGAARPTSDKRRDSNRDDEERDDDEDDLLPTQVIAGEHDLDDDLDADLDEHSPEHSAHKKIPTWQDAIGMLVDANLASRSKGSDYGPRGRRGRGSR